MKAKNYTYVCSVYKQDKESDDKELVLSALELTARVARSSVLRSQILDKGLFCRSIQLASVDGVPASFVE